MRNVNTNPDPLVRVHDDDLRQVINRLDRVHVGLIDMQASPVLDDSPELQGELCGYARIVRAAADLFFRLREENHQETTMTTNLVHNFHSEVAKLQAELSAQVVGLVMGKPVTRGELQLAFNTVANKEHWKFPIDATVELDKYSKAIVAKAVCFFTGSAAKFKRLGGTTMSGIGKYRVTAAGYYKTIGA